MICRTIELIQSLREGYPIKSGNYCVKMSVYNKPVKTYFLTPKQWFRLSDLFNFGEDGEAQYSNRDNQIYGVFEDDRFIWAGAKKQLEWMARTFSAELATNIAWQSSEEKKRMPTLKPRDTEVLPELRDTDEKL